jgi:hypothetical protein
MFLFEVTDALEKEKIPYAVVGGYALALQGLVRATMDVDLVIDLKLLDFERTERTFEKLGLSPRLPVRGHEVFKMRKEYIEKRNLIAWSFVDYKNPTRQIDVIITLDRRKIEIKQIAVSGRKISVASLEALLKMKRASARPQDLIDVKNIEEKLVKK